MLYTKKVKVLEKDIQRTICDYLDLNKYFFWRSNNIPVYSDGKFRAMPKYSPKGLPDILILHKGYFIGVEVKRPKGYTNPKQRIDQAEFALRMRVNGGFYYTATCLEDVLCILELLL